MKFSDDRRVTELVVFQLKSDVDKSEFLKAAEELNDVLQNQASGFIHRSLEHTEDHREWIDIIKWESMDCALEALEIVKDKAEFCNFSSMIETKSSKMLHLIPPLNSSNNY